MLNNGRTSEATHLYIAATKAEPENTEAWLMLGAIYGETGQIDKAINACRYVLKIDNRDVDAYTVLGRLFLNQGNKEDAANCFRSALKYDPDYGDVWEMLANLSGLEKNYEEAELCCRNVIRLTPESADYHIKLCHALMGQKKTEEACKTSNTATRLNPNNPEAWLVKALAQEQNKDPATAKSAYTTVLTLQPNHSEAITGLGRVLTEQNLCTEAETLLEKAISNSPDTSSFQLALAAIYEKQNKHNKAEAVYREILEKHPETADTWINLGNLLLNSNRLNEADSCYSNAIQIAPNNHYAYYNQGVLNNRSGKQDKANQLFDTAITLNPDFAEAHWDKSFIELLNGNFSNGWAEYEWRKKCPQYIPRHFSLPEWDGTPLNNKTILIHDEQGYGDTFQFIRYLAPLKKSGATVIFECHRNLKAILKSNQYFDEIIERMPSGDPPAVSYDTHAHLMSLPYLLKTTIDTIPQSTPYLSAQENLIAYWKTRIQGSGLNIGICWAGSAKHTNEMNRSCPLAEFLPLADIENINFYSLQMGEPLKQADTLKNQFDMIRFDSEMDRNGRFLDTAALMMNLDLIITIDTSIAHLAGALGRPVWVLLCTSPDWRWLRNRLDSPWYPTMRLFRQTEANNWKAVIKDISNALQSIV